MLTGFQDEDMLIAFAQVRGGGQPERASTDNQDGMISDHEGLFLTQGK